MVGFHGKRASGSDEFERHAPAFAKRSRKAPMSTMLVAGVLGAVPDAPLAQAGADTQARACILERPIARSPGPDG